MSCEITVLGSEGQIGTYLVNYLESKGHFVHRFDIIRNQSHDLRTHTRNLHLLIEKSDFVYFLAFDVGGSTYLEKYQNTFDFINNNIKIMDTTFGILNVTKTPFVFASSQMSQMLFSTYGLLKLIGERWTETMKFGKYVRFWNVYGIEPDSTKFHVISDFITMARDTGIIRMRTNGEEQRNFLYAEDCAEGLYSIMEHFDDIPEGAPLHLASHQNITILELANLIAREYSASVVPANKTDSLQMMVQNTPDPFLYRYWSPKTSLEAGVRKIGRMMQKHD